VASITLKSIATRAAIH